MSHRVQTFCTRSRSAANARKVNSVEKKSKAAFLKTNLFIDTYSSARTSNPTESPVHWIHQTPPVFMHDLSVTVYIYISNFLYSVQFFYIILLVCSFYSTGFTASTFFSCSKKTFPTCGTNKRLTNLN